MKLTQAPEFNEEAVHVWEVPIAPTHLIGELEDLLSPDELDRARKYKSHLSQMQFVTTRATLRQLLGLYLGKVPGAVRFSYSARGKPALIGESSLAFNVSHSGHRALIAIAPAGQIGIDIEHVRPLPDKIDIAQRFFCCEETAQLMSLPESERDLAFFKCWTRKEAYIKCVGDGLSIPLDAFQITIVPALATSIVKLTGNPTQEQIWAVRDLSFDDKYAAAVAYSGKPARLRYISIGDTERTWVFGE